MSPILKEPDRPDSIPVPSLNTETPFPEVINSALQSPALNSIESSSQSVNKPGRDFKPYQRVNDVTSERNDRKKLSNTKPINRKINKNQDKRDANFKRSQSLRIKSPQYNRKIDNTKAASGKSSCGTVKSDVSEIESTKSCKFRMFKHRFSVFPKGIREEKEDKENDSYHDLRRSQSMRVVTKEKNLSITSDLPLKSVISISKIIPKSIAAEGSKLPQLKYAIQNSKSYVDVSQFNRNSHKIPKSISSKTINNTNNNTLNNDKLYSASVKSLRNSHESSGNNKEQNQTRNFAHKTINVIRKSVSSKLRGNVEKEVMPKQTSIPVHCKVKQIDIDLENSTNAARAIQLTLPNTKRKKNDNESDTEVKPKKKPSLHEINACSNPNKENSIYSPSFKSKYKETYKETKRASNNICHREKIKYLPHENNTNKIEKKSPLNTGIKNCLNIKSNNLKNNIKSDICVSEKHIPDPHLLVSGNSHERQSNFSNVNVENRKDEIPTKSKSANAAQNTTNKLKRHPNSISPNHSGSILPLKADGNGDKYIKGKSINNEVILINSASNNSSIDVCRSPYFENSVAHYRREMSTTGMETKELEPNSQSQDLFSISNCNFEEIMGDYSINNERVSFHCNLFKENSVLFGIGESLYEQESRFSLPLNQQNKMSIIYEFNDLPDNNGSVLLNKFGHDNFDSYYVNDAKENNLISKQQLTPKEVVNIFNVNNSNFKEDVLRSPEIFYAWSEVLHIPKCFNDATPNTELEGFKSYKENLILSECSLGTCVPVEYKPETCLNCNNNDIIHESKSDLEKELSAKRLLNEQIQDNKNIKKVLERNTAKAINDVEINIQQLATNPQIAFSIKNVMKKKALSENCIIRDNEKAKLLKKEKSEIQFSRKQRNEETQNKKRESKMEIAKSFCSSNFKEKDDKVAENSFRACKDDKNCLEMPSAGTRRSKIDYSKNTSNRTPKLVKGNTSRAKQSDPVKVLRPAIANGQIPTHGPLLSGDKIKKIEAELSLRTQETRKAKDDVEKTNRRLEALTVLVHYLTNDCDAFSTGKLKTEIKGLNSQLTDVRLCLDESTATVRRFEQEEKEKRQKQAEEVEKLEASHRQQVDSLVLEHESTLETVLEHHRKELRELISEEECKFEKVKNTHKTEIQNLEVNWKGQLDQLRTEHLAFVEQINANYTQQLTEAESTWECREQDLLETNRMLLKQQSVLKQETKDLEQTLLSDKDHRLQAAKKLCSALQSEVDSLKSVLDMRNGEIHNLRAQIVDKERMSDELESAREKVRSFQAKSEDLQAQMDQKHHLERQLLADHHALSESLQKETSLNKRLALENEQLMWKLRQREAASTSLPTSSIDLVTGASTTVARQQERCSKTGAVLSPKLTPRSPRIGSKRNEKWSQSFTNIPEDAGRHKDLWQDDMTFESPPPSPRVKAVVEKSNSVSFILDLNDTFEEEPFLREASPHQVAKLRTPVLQKKKILRKSATIESEKPKIKPDFSGPLTYHSTMINGKMATKVIPISELNRLELNDMDSNDAWDRNLSRFHSISHNSGDFSTSESSDGGDIERISPTGLAWTVPVHSKVKSFSNHIPNRFHVVPETSRHLQLPDEDEYEENENEFVEVLTLSEDLSSASLKTIFNQTPSTSVSLSDSDVSQCGSRTDLTTEDDCSDLDEILQKDDHSRPQEGAGEAMVFPDFVAVRGNKKDQELISQSQISSDSEDFNNQPMNDERASSMSWSEDAECDLTSSSETHEIL